jgi:beta-glucosidase
MRFPQGFLWGAATASYQIEGAAHEDGRGESIWDRFSRVPGNIVNGDTGDVADDHYHRYASDVDLMAELGLQGYRFSVAWPRIYPTGSGPVNEKGVDFYKRLVDKLHSKKITPAATLYHWDLPQALQEKGGWANRDTVERFAEYAATIFRALGDQVPLWITHNEPWCSSFLGHFRGVHAPGIKDLKTALAAAHHILLSHGRAVQELRATGSKSQIGMTLSLFPTYPLHATAEDREAARLSDGYTNRWFLDPTLKGAYPTDAVANFERLVGPLDYVRDGDMATIGGPMDFVGVNYYHRRSIESAPANDLGWIVHDRLPGTPTTDMGWEIVPHCLTDLLLRLQADYGNIPVYITENGAVMDDEISPDGQVHDPKRVDFLRLHFEAAHKAIEGGANLKGYFVWSFMDNYEWAFGYTKRFGIVYVDYATQRRIPKDSARFLSQVIAKNGL